MESFAQLTEILGQWTRRRLWFNFLNWLPWAGLIALVPAFLAALYSRLQPGLLNREIALLALISLGLMFLLSTIYFWGKRPSLLEQARFGDQQFGLRERTVTAVELHKGLLVASPDLQKLQLEETLTAVQRIDTKKEFPQQISLRKWLPFLLAAFLLAAALFFDNPQELHLQQSREMQKTIAREAQVLEEMAAKISEQGDLNPAQQKALSEPLREAAQKLGVGNLSQEEAVAALSEAEEQLQTLHQALTNEEQIRAWREAGESLASAEAGKSLGQALKENDLTQAQGAAADLAERLPGLALSDQEALAGALQEAAGALQAEDPALADYFNKAANSLMARDLPAAQDALTSAGQSLEQAVADQAMAAQAQALAEEIAASRQVVAQAGQNDEGLPGDTEAGQDGLANQVSPNDESSSEPKNVGAGDTTGQAVEIPEGSGSGESAGSGGSVQNIYIPAPRDLDNVSGTPVELLANCQGDPQTCGVLIDESAAEFGLEGSFVPYNQVFAAYQEVANEALAKEAIPLRLKDTVHQYFSSLE